MKGVFIILACVVAVFTLYWLIAYALRLNDRERMKRQGRTISWELAIERVRGGDGFFIIAISGQNRELRFAPGDIPNGTGRLRDIYDARANLVEGYVGRIALPELKNYGVEERCSELDLDALM